MTSPRSPRSRNQTDSILELLRSPRELNRRTWIASHASPADSIRKTGVQSLLPLSSPWRPDPGQAVRRTSPGNSGTAGGSSAGSSSRGQPPSHSQALISLHSVRKRSKPQPWRKAPQTSPRLTHSEYVQPLPPLKHSRWPCAELPAIDADRFAAGHSVIWQEQEDSDEEQLHLNPTLHPGKKGSPALSSLFLEEPSLESRVSVRFKPFGEIEEPSSPKHPRSPPTMLPRRSSLDGATAESSATCGVGRDSMVETFFPSWLLSFLRELWADGLLVDAMKEEETATTGGVDLEEKQGPHNRLCVHPGLHQTRCGATLKVHICGFQGLADNMCARGPQGADTLLSFINGYIGRMVSCIRDGGGDVLAVCGETLIAFFPQVAQIGEEKSSPHSVPAIARACICASKILFQSKGGHSLLSDVDLQPRTSWGRRYPWTLVKWC